MHKKLDGEVALITGGDSGIGRATAIAFAHDGADVAVTYHRDRGGADQTCQQIRASGRRALALQLDQSDPAAVAEVFAAVRRQLGVPTVLVNNAAMSGANRPVKDLPVDDWDRQIRTNLYGPFYCCQQFIRALAGSDRHGVILNISSVHQDIPTPGAAAYNVAKGGLENLTATLALELAESNISVNTIAPGMVLTPMNQTALDDPAARERQVQAIPLKRAAEPEEIARVAVFLASADARYIQGATIVVDGGLSLMLGQGA